MSTEKRYNFRDLYKNKLEKRIVDYIETVSGLYEDTDIETMTKAQVALASKSIENIALMILEGGYVSSRGNFIPFSPTDLLTVQTALKEALALRSDLMLLPTGATSSAQLMDLLAKLDTKQGIGGTKDGAGFAEEPPELSALDEKQSAETFDSFIKEDVEEQKVVYPVSLPKKNS
jgi:hypothetical protein